jgi:cold shock protein
VVFGMATGIVIRFDELRGYGFITPDSGTEDVFMHANDLLDDKYLFHPGVRVEFEVEDGERGLKASDVRIVDNGGGARDGGPARGGGSGRERSSAPRESRPEGGGEVDEGVCDLLSAGEFQHELTEAALKVSPSLTGAQILDLRARVIELARSHRWLDS